MVCNKIYWVSKIFIKDHWCIAFNEGNKRVLVKNVNLYRADFLNALPGYYCCVTMENGDILIRDRAIVVEKSAWDKIHKGYKGVYLDYDGKHPELKGRKTVLSGCVGDYSGALLIEGMHFVIV